MKKIFSFIFCLFVVLNVWGETDSSAQANRRTAMRYLTLAKNYAAQEDWASVREMAVHGLEYDDSVADLYYFNALSLFKLGSSRGSVILEIEKPFVSKKADWVDYNLTNARLFYADMLCNTGLPDKAISVLDEEPLVYSSDAEYIRIKSLYQINTKESVIKAEEKIDSARRVYPGDVRFFYLFFYYEYNLSYQINSEKNGFTKIPLSPVAQKIADSFIEHVPDYDKNYKDLEIISNFFTQGEKRSRLLKAFNARGFKHVLYPIAALETGIMTQEQALDYFLEFIDSEIDAKIFFQFYSMITEEDSKKYFDEYLENFKGTLLYDISNTLESNLNVKYERGRAVKITYDENNDDINEWEAELDFGSPKKLFVFNQNSVINFGTYPNVLSIVFNDIIPESGVTVFDIIDAEYVSKPFDIVKSPFVSAIDFFTVDPDSVISGAELFDSDKIYQASNSMDKPSFEKDNARIKFSILDGVPYKAEYYCGSEIYAHAHFFSSGNPAIVRDVDTDGDGIFETKEIYYTDDDFSFGASEETKAAVTTKLWGSPLTDANVYLRKVEIDTNRDTIPDFMEIYSAHDGKETVWDSDFDGAADVMYKKYPEEKGQPKREDNSYYVSDISGNMTWVVVQFVDGVPDTITKGGESVKVVSGVESNFFWIGQRENDSYEKNVYGQKDIYSNGQMFQIEESDCYIRVIKIGTNIFARRIEKENNLNKEQAGDSDQDAQ